MKKKVVFLLILLMLPFRTAFAADAPSEYVDVLKGKPFKEWGTLNYSFTDDNTSTGSRVYGVLVYTFPEPVNIAGYSTYGVGGNYGATTRVVVSYVSGTTDLLSSSNGYVQKYIKGVKSISLVRSGTEGGPGTFYDIKMYVNPDEKIKRPVTESDQEAGPDYLMVTWTKTEDAVSYVILLNGKQVGTAGADATSFKITKAMGYNPSSMFNRTQVQAKLEDGSTGESSGGGNPLARGMGFDSHDIWENGLSVVVSLASFLLLGILIRFVPRLFRLARAAILNRRGMY